MRPKYRCEKCAAEWNGWTINRNGDRCGPICIFCGGIKVTWINYEEMKATNFK